MPVYLESFRQWIRQVYATRDEELDCDEFYELVPRYVDMEVAGEDASRLFPNVTHHLEQCAECHDMYLALRDVVQLDAHEFVPELVRVRRSTR